MALLVSDILDDVRTILIDTLGVRWPDEELIDWFNDACRQVVVIKPDSNPITEEYTCIAGAKQPLTEPAVSNDLILLFDVPNTTTTGGGTEQAVTFVKRNVMDSERPQWRSDTPSNTIAYYMYDDWQRDFMYVYPPATVGTTIEIIYAGAPTVVTLLTDPFPLQDIYGPIVVNYIVWRAMSKDSDFSGNMQLAGGYYAMFMQGLTGKIASEASDMPERNIPPNIKESVG